ncbi:MAG: helix-turn-helix domain-containing protein [Phascolarctobacterium faecium]
MELARLLGISQTHLSNIEKGRTDQPALAGENG